MPSTLNAQSREILVTLEALTSGAKSTQTSYYGPPGCASTTLALTLNSCSLISKVIQINALTVQQCEIDFLLRSTSSSKSSPGSGDKSRRRSATCMDGTLDGLMHPLMAHQNQILSSSCGFPAVSAMLQ